MASSKNDLGCCRQTFTRTALEDRLQAEDGGLVETAAESRPRWLGRGCGERPGRRGTLRRYEQFQVFQTRSASQQVVGDVQHMVGLVVGQMDFQQVEGDGRSPDRARAFGPAGAWLQFRRGGRSRAVSDFVMDVRGSHDGPVTPSVIVLVQALYDPPLASFDLFSYLGVHSKTSVLRNGDVVVILNTSENAEGFRDFYPPTQADIEGFRLAKG